MKLTYSQLDELNSAYLFLPFKTDTIMAAAENITKLKPHLDAVLTLKAKLIKQYTNGEDNISSSHQNWNKFSIDFHHAISKEIEVVGLTKVKKTDLDLVNINPSITNNGTKINYQGYIAVLLNFGLLE